MFQSRTFPGCIQGFWKSPSSGPRSSATHPVGDTRPAPFGGDAYPCRVTVWRQTCSHSKLSEIHSTLQINFCTQNCSLCTWRHNHPYLLMKTNLQPWQSTAVDIATDRALYGVWQSHGLMDVVFLSTFSYRNGFPSVLIRWGFSKMLKAGHNSELEVKQRLQHRFLCW